MGKALSVLAAAMLATTVVGTQQGCAAFDARIERVANRTINSRETRLRQDLEQIMRSVFCVRTQSKYRITGTSQTVTRTSYGTAFAYEHRDGNTYLTTNAHVISAPKDIMRFGASGFVHYQLLERRLTIVDNNRDTNPSDDILLSEVTSNDDIDIAVLRTGRTLPISDRFIRDPSFRAKVGEEAYILGYPRAFLKTQTKGVVSRPNYDTPNIGHLDFLDITATFGNSGSPYFVRRGEKLYWAGTIGRVWTYGSSGATMYSLGYPVHLYSKMLVPDKGKKR